MLSSFSRAFTISSCHANVCKKRRIIICVVFLIFFAYLPCFAEMKEYCQNHYQTFYVLIVKYMYVQQLCPCEIIRQKRRKHDNYFGVPRMAGSRGEIQCTTHVIFRLFYFIQDNCLINYNGLIMHSQDSLSEVADEFFRTITEIPRTVLEKFTGETL